MHHSLIPYTYEAQLRVEILNKDKMLASMVDVDIEDIPLGQIILNQPNSYVLNNKHNYSTDFYPDDWNKTIRYTMLGTWQRSEYRVNGHLFAGFSDSERVEQKFVDIKVGWKVGWCRVAEGQRKSSKPSPILS